MKALTLYQPWAQLVADGRKRIETRSWGTLYRGLLAIHAARGGLDTALAAKAGYDAGTLPRGAVVAVAELRDVVMMTPAFLAAVTEEEWQWGWFAPGRYAWRLGGVDRFAEPVTVSGGRGLWEWTPADESVKRVKVLRG